MPSALLQCSGWSSASAFSGAETRVSTTRGSRRCVRCRTDNSGSQPASSRRLTPHRQRLHPIPWGWCFPHPRYMTATLRTDLDDFLFAPIAQDANGMPLTVASVLARLDVDPWAEAAVLADMSREAATEKLIALLAGVPNGPSPGADTATLASHLVVLLHPSPKPRVS